MPGTKKIRTLDDIVRAAMALKQTPTVAVAMAEDRAVLSGLAEAMNSSICRPILIGDKASIQRTARSLQMSLRDIEIVHEPEPYAACAMAVTLCREGRAGLIMKGIVATATLLKAVLDREAGLYRKLLSHAAVVYSPIHDRLFIAADAAVNIAPDVSRKLGILDNTLRLAKALGMDRPRVAMLAAVEKIKPEMSATTDAAIIAQMARNGQLGDCLVDGPFALDMAVSPESAKTKKGAGPVAGKADILIAPDIEAANILYKSMIFFAGMEAACCVLGAEVPMIVSSRSDSGPTKFYSISLASLLSARGMG